MSDESFEYDVFLSHSSKDKTIVSQLAERLRADGLRVWYDEWEIEPGDSIPARVEAGLEHSRVLALCMSSSAFESEWTQLEAGTFRYRDPLNTQGRLITIRLDDAPIPGSLSQFRYIDWLPESQETAYPELRDYCKPANSAPPRIDETLEEAVDGVPIPKEETDHSTTTRMPSPSNPNLEHTNEAHRSASWTSSADFFAERFSAAFPGLRDGFAWFADSEDIAWRLDRLLKMPLSIGHHIPVWWFRGHHNNSISRFGRLNDREWLLNHDELRISRIGAAYDESYWRRFVYVETDAAPSALDEANEADIAAQVSRFGYADEEVGLFEGRYYTRACFDDGSAVIDGRGVSFDGRAELRVRFLSPYNFIICAIDSPINNHDFDYALHELLNGMLRGNINADQLVAEIGRLPIQYQYHDF